MSSILVAWFKSRRLHLCAFSLSLCFYTTDISLLAMSCSNPEVAAGKTKMPRECLFYSLVWGYTARRWKLPAVVICADNRPRAGPCWRLHALPRRKELVHRPQRHFLPVGVIALGVTDRKLVL